MTPVILRSDLPGLPVRRGKVRDVYELGDRLLLVATDRVSAFDVVLADGIPDKGRILTALSAFWFQRFGSRFRHHLLEVIGRTAPPPLEPHAETLRGRAMLCARTQVVPIECVVRGFLAGSGWKEYEQMGSVCGLRLPAGLKRCGPLPEPIFTPATKAVTGHDENIPFERACEIAGVGTMQTLRERSVALYREAAEYACGRGILIADTKFEFGRLNDELILIDELLTPDSSRFWPADAYEPGREPESFDKQYVRDYLERLCAAGHWDKRPPGPPLPPDVVAGTRRRYVEAYERITGRPFA